MNTTVADDADREEVSTEAADEKRTLNLAVDVSDSGPCRKHVRITVPRVDIDGFYKEEIVGLIDQAVVPGFRKGHVPQGLVERRFRKELADQVKQKILFESLDQVSKSHGIDPINEPELDVKALEIPEEGDFSYEFDVEVRPQFDLPDYAGLQIERPVRTTTDEDVNAALSRYLEMQGTMEDRVGPAQPRDFVEVSGEFSFNGRPASSFSRLEIQVLPTLNFQDAELKDFDKLMVGVEAGQTREADVVVSSEAEKVELRGETVHLKLNVHSVLFRKSAELSSELLQRLGSESEEDLRDEVRNSLDRQVKFEQRQSARRQVLAKITQAADWDLPEGAVRRQVENALRREILEMQQSGFSSQEIMSRENSLRQRAISTTRQALKEHFVLDKIATTESIEIQQADLEQEIRLMAMQSGESPRRVRARMIRTGMIDNLEAQIRERKAIELILDKATYVDVDAPAPSESQTEAVPISVCGNTTEQIATDAEDDDE